MKKLLYVLLLISFITSCNSSLTKRHYRKGLHWENAKKTTSSNIRRDTNIGNEFSKGFGAKKIDSLRLRSLDTLQIPSLQCKTKESKKVSIDLKEKKKVTFEFRSNNQNLKKKDSSIKTGIRKWAHYGWGESYGIFILLILIAAILFFIVMATNFSTIAMIFLLAYIGVLVVVSVIYLVLILSGTISEEVEVKTEEMNGTGDKYLWKFRNNLSKLGVLNWISIVCIGLSVALIFVLLRGALFFGVLGVLFLFAASIRAFIMMRSYRKCKHLLNEAEIKEYEKKRVLNLILFGLLILILIGATLAFILI